MGRGFESSRNRQFFKCNDLYEPNQNLAITGLSRSGTTIVGSVFANYFSKKFPNVCSEYQHQILHHGYKIPEYHVKDNFLLRKNIGLKEYNDEETRMIAYKHVNMIENMIDSNYKTILKIEPYVIYKQFYSPFVMDVLKKLNYVYVKRNNLLELFLSVIISKTKLVWHTNNSDDISEDNIFVHKKNMKEFEEKLKAEDWFLKQVNIVAKINYEDITSNEDILKLLNIDDFHSWEDNNQFVKRLPYKKNKIDYIINKDEVINFIESMRV